MSDQARRDEDTGNHLTRERSQGGSNGRTTSEGERREPSAALRAARCRSAAVLCLPQELIWPGRQTGPPARSSWMRLRPSFPRSHRCPRFFIAASRLWTVARPLGEWEVLISSQSKRGSRRRRMVGWVGRRHVPGVAVTAQAHQSNRPDPGKGEDRGGRPVFGSSQWQPPPCCIAALHRFLCLWRSLSSPCSDRLLVFFYSRYLMLVLLAGVS